MASAADAVVRIIQANHAAAKPNVNSALGRRSISLSWVVPHNPNPNPNPNLLILILILILIS
jgi:hypothetical protein